MSRCLEFLLAGKGGGVRVKLAHDWFCFVLTHIRHESVNELH